MNRSALYLVFAIVIMTLFACLLVGLVLVDSSPCRAAGRLRRLGGVGDSYRTRALVVGPGYIR